MANSVKRAQTEAECPFFRRLCDKGIVCEGVTLRGKIIYSFVSRAARDRWVRQYCARYASAAARCPMADMLEERHGGNGLPLKGRGGTRPLQDDDPGRREPHRHNDGDGGKLQAVKVVADARRVKAFLSGETDRIVLPDAGIYRILFGEIPREGETRLVELVAAGENAGPIMTAFISRERSDGVTEPYGGEMWVIGRIPKG